MYTVHCSLFIIIINLLLKVRTRLGADAKWRLTVEELELFVNQLETLPAKVSKQEVWYRVSLRSMIASFFLTR